MKTILSLIRLILVTALLLLSTAPLSAQSEVPSDDVTQESLRFTQVFAVVEQNYVDAADPDQIILEGGIRGMLGAPAAGRPHTARPR